MLAAVPPLWLCSQLVAAMVNNKKNCDFSTVSRGHNKNPEYPPRPSLGEKRAAIQRKADCISPSPQTVTTDFPWWSATPFFIRVWQPRSKTKATNIIVKILFPALNFTIVWAGKRGKAGRRPQHPMVAAFHASLGQAILFGKDWIAWALFSYGKGRMGQNHCAVGWTF